MFQASIGSKNFFGLFLERLVKRLRYKEFGKIRKCADLKSWRKSGQNGAVGGGRDPKLIELLRGRGSCGRQSLQFIVSKDDL
jgi:hypothetical protein